MTRVLVCLAVALAASTVARAAEPVTVVSADCRHGQQRPKGIVLACGDANARMSGLRWSAWGGAVATANGRYAANDCTPDCADGTFRAQPAAVRLSRRRSCPGRTHRYYLRATVVLRSGRHISYEPGCPYG